jgi:hypothetical protein
VLTLLNEKELQNILWLLSYAAADLRIDIMAHRADREQKQRLIDELEKKLDDLRVRNQGVS